MSECSNGLRIATKDVRLIRCPECDGEAELISYFITGIANKRSFFARCRPNRCVRTRIYNKRSKAISAWNHEDTL